MVVATLTGVGWGLIIIWLISGIVGSMIAQSKNRPPWQGALLGFLLGIIGVFIIAVMSKQPEPAGAAADSARSSSPIRASSIPASPANGEVRRPQTAVDRLKKAQAAYGRGAYPEAVACLSDELYDAAGRGDRESVGFVVVLADKIARNPYAHVRLQEDALKLVASGRGQLDRWGVPVPPELQLPVADEVESSAVPPVNADTPLSIISARYARGEITRDEFLQLKADLGE